MPSTGGNMGATYFQEFGPRVLTCLQLVGTWVKNVFRNLVLFFDMPSASGYMDEKYFQEIGPRFWRVIRILACHVPNVACHGVSIFVVSISSVSCCVRILLVSVSMPWAWLPCIL